MFTGFKDVGLTWLLIWAADLCDLGLHIIEFLIGPLIYSFGLILG